MPISINCLCKASPLIPLIRISRTIHPLAREYRNLGRLDEAEAIENEVLRMLKYADADHPIVRQINESRASL